jgi:hypothetical protein
MHAALPFFHTGIYTPRVHCLYGTLKLNLHFDSQYNVQVETGVLEWLILASCESSKNKDAVSKLLLV